MSRELFKVKKGLSIKGVTSYPSDAEEGDIVFRTDLSPSKLKIYKSGIWTNLSTSSEYNIDSANDNTSGANVTLAAITAPFIRLTNASLQSIDMIPAGSAGDVILVTNATGTVVLVNNDTGATAANRIITGTNAPAIMMNNVTYTLIYDGTSLRWKMVGGAGASAGGGSKNYLSSLITSQSATPNTGNGDFELASTMGWSLFNTTVSGSMPTGAITSGAASLTSFSVVSAGSQLAGGYSLQVGTTSGSAWTSGQGFISDAFYIDNADQAKVLTVKVSYKCTSGASNLNWSGTTANNLAIAIYDVNSSQWIQPAGSFGFTQSSGSGQVVATFQTSSVSIQYRVAVLNVGGSVAGSTGATTVLFDDISVGPQAIVQGSPITDWQSYTPTFTGFGTVTTQSFSWRRVGANVEIRGRFTVGTPTATEARLSLPGGLTSSSIINTLEIAGDAGRNQGASATFFRNIVLIEPNVAYLTFGKQESTANSLTKQNGSAVVTAGDIFAVNAAIPVAGWSSQVQMSSDTDTRVVAAIVSGDPASATSGNPIIVPTVSYDSHGAYNATTGRYTCPVTGIYKIFGALQSASAATTLTVYKNAVSTALAGSLDSNGEATFCASVNCSAGDIIDLRPGGTVDATNITLNIERLSGPSVVAATESINARYSTTAGQSISSGATAIVNFGTSTYDSHSAVTTGASWKFTAPTTGRYTIKANVVLASGSWLATQQPYLNLYKNGAQVSAGPLFYISATGTWVIPLHIMDTVQLNAGEYIDVRLLNASSNTQSLSINAWQNYISIVKED